MAGQSPRSLAAIENLARLVQLVARCRVEVVDLLVHPLRALPDQVIAIPTLVRRWPLPPLHVAGDLSDLDHVLAELELQPVSGEP